MRLHPAVFGASACFWLIAALARLAPGVVGGLGDLPLAVPAAMAAGLGAGLLSPGGHKPAEELLSTLLRLVLLLGAYALLGLFYLHPEPGLVHGMVGGLLPSALFVGHALAMVPPGRALAPALDELDGLGPRAALRALGPAAAANAALFGLALFYDHPLLRLLPALAFLLLWGLWLKLPRRGLNLAAGLAAACLALAAVAGWRLTWSFDHALLPAPITSRAVRLLLPPEQTRGRTRERPEVWTGVIIDNSFGDFCVDLDSVRLQMTAPAAPRQVAVLSGMAEFYRLPFRLRPPGRALIVNSGLGNTLAAGLREGWQALEALEPDPDLLRLGRTHPERPYQAPGLVIHHDRPRSFFRRDTGTWDLIVLAPVLADRLSSRFSGAARPEPLYTAQFFQVIAERLSTDGVVAVMLSAPPFVEQRLFQMLSKQFGPAAAWSWTNTAWGQQWTLIAAGPGVHRYRPRPGPGLVDRTEQLRQAPPLAPATDDWPYLFYSGRGIRFFLILTMMVMVGGAGLLLVPAGSFRNLTPPLAGGGAFLAGLVMRLWAPGIMAVAVWSLAAALLALAPLVPKRPEASRRTGSALAGFGILLASSPVALWLGPLWPEVAGGVSLALMLVTLGLRHGGK